MTDTLYCLSVWNVVKDHLAFLSRNCVASRKRVQRYSFFQITKQIPRKIYKKVRNFSKHHTLVYNYIKYHAFL